ncbi:glycopeptide antibiotics resistance protein [Geomicrobium halophilum]|uniref:Glycopeptide antibiotics resistance protein n=1 Tax=Geomicrobium halophilum TaxID=549000 RepID=A0A841PVH1_9BACL|nr:glycopeptide antibiotics resistance protein [Geomicrobium halophilum]
MNRQPIKMLAWSFFAIYMAVLIYITMLAWNHGASLGPDGPGGRNYNLIPFRSIYRIGVFSPTFFDPLKILIGNVLLFVPLGFYLPLLFKGLQSMGKIILVGAFVSLFIELYQFTFTLRVSDIDDLVLNTFGVFIGAVWFFSCRKISRRIIIIPPDAPFPSRRSGSINGNSHKQ